MLERHFDFLILGGGSGGVAAANRAASYGAKVALVENDYLGGTCVNRGCVPKKLSWYAAHTAETLRDAPNYGFAPVRIQHDFGALRKARDRYIRYLNGRYEENLKANGVTIIHGKGKFLDPYSIEANGERLVGRHILIATGSRPRPLNIPGGNLAMTSDDFFELSTRPARVAMIGAGFIAAELGGVFAALGSKVTMYLGPREPLAHFDPFIGAAFREILERQGIRCLKQTVAGLRTSGPKNIEVVTDDGTAIDESTFDAVFNATGRLPNSQALELEKAGVQLDEWQAITVDRFQSTNWDHIHAVGDVTSRGHQLTPVAIAAGRRLADRLFGGMPDRYLDYEFVPAVVFSHPPVGTVGFTEAEARDNFTQPVKAYTSRFTPLSSALSEHPSIAAIKLITAGPKERIVGIHALGDGADELLQGFAVAIRMGATKRDFDDTVAIHPTTSEELVTLR